LFDCVPLLARLFLQPYFGGVLNLLVPYTAVVSNLNLMANVFIYITRMHELRVGIKNLLKCNRLSKVGLQVAVSTSRQVNVSEFQENKKNRV
jgi:hypothetical protein